MAGLFPTGGALGAMPDASVVRHLGLAVADEGPTPGKEPGGSYPGAIHRRRVVPRRQLVHSRRASHSFSVMVCPLSPPSWWPEFSRGRL